MKIRSTHTCVKSSQNIAVFQGLIIGISSKSAKAGVSKVWWSLRTKEFRMKLLISGGSTMAANVSSISHSSLPFGTYSDRNFSDDMDNLNVSMKKPVTYNLQGIKDRLKER